MRKRLQDFGCLPFLKVMGVAMLASMTGACSSDILRFSDSPFSNPFQGKIDPATTGGVEKPIRGLKSAGLAAPQSYQPLPGGAGAQGQAVAAAAQAAQSGSSPVTGSVAGWTATGGTPVTLGAGDTLDTLSSRYGVPVAALRAANGLSSGQPSAGQRVIIPAYNPGAPAAKVASSSPTYAPVAAAAPAKAAAPRYEPLPAAAPVRKETPKAERKPRYEPLAARAAEEAPAPKKAEVRKIEPKKVEARPPEPRKQAQAKPAEQRPAARPQAAAQPASKKDVKTAVRKVVEDDDQPMPPKPRTAKVATAPQPAKPEAKVARAEPRLAPKAEPQSAPKAEAKPEETTASADQEFRWPARGRVISGYGSKGPSGANDGINIAVPEGTPVKAAETGTVAYAGEEIKGYGKMVLIRHPNGYVSAYAHNGELNVKRGDSVKRGQQIAKSGQSGNVTSPQLHFELRKGSEPVDPAKFLD